MKHFFTCCFLLAYALTVQGQETVGLTEYLNNFENPCEKSEASYVVLTQINRQLQKHGEATAYFIENGAKTTQLYYKGLFEAGKKQGLFVYYYPNGEKSTEGKYKEDKPVGIWKEWYKDKKGKVEHLYEPTTEKDFTSFNLRKVINFWDSTQVQLVKDGTGHYYTIESDLIEQGSLQNSGKHGKWVGKYLSGQVYYEETWKEGVLQEGKSYDSQNKEYVYNTLQKNAVYVGGQQAMAEHLRKHFKYPKKARRRSVESTVYVRFIIDKQGNVRDAKAISKTQQNLEIEAIKTGLRVYAKIKNAKFQTILVEGYVEDFKKTYPELEMEAVRLVNTFPAWETAMLRGQLVSVYFVLPIAFKLVD